MIKKSRFLNEVNLSQLGGTTSGSKSLDDIRSSKKETEAPAKKQQSKEDTAKKDQAQDNQVQQPVQNLSVQDQKKLEKPAQKKSSKRQEISDEYFQSILALLSSIDLKIINEEDKKLIKYISSNFKKFTDEQIDQIKRNKNFNEIFLKDNDLTNDSVKYFKQFINKFDNNYFSLFKNKDEIFQKFASTDPNLIKSHDIFKKFISSFLDISKEIVRSSLIADKKSLSLNFDKINNKIFVFIENPSSQDHDSLYFYCLKFSSFAFDQKENELDIDLKIYRGQIKDITGKFYFTGNDKLFETVKLSIDLNKLTQIIGEANIIVIENDEYKTIKNLLTLFAAPDQSVKNEIKRIEKELEREEQEKNRKNEPEIKSNSNKEEANQSNNQEIVGNENQQKEHIQSNQLIPQKIIIDRNNKVINSLDNIDKNLNVYISNNDQFKFLKVQNDTLDKKSIENLQNSKKVNLKKLYENMTLVIKTQTRNEFVHFYNRKRGKEEEIKDFTSYFLGKFKSSKVGNYIESVFGKRNNVGHIGKVKVVLLTEKEMEAISNGGYFINDAGARQVQDTNNQEEQNDSNASDIFKSFEDFQENLFTSILNKALGDIKADDWKYVGLSKETKKQEFREKFVNSIKNGSEYGVFDNQEETSQRDQSEQSDQPQSDIDKLDEESANISDDYKNDLNDNDIYFIKSILDGSFYNDKNDKNKAIKNRVFRNLIDIFLNQLFSNKFKQGGFNATEIFTTKFNPDIVFQKMTNDGVIYLQYGSLKKIEKFNELLERNNLDLNKENVKNLIDFFKKGKIVKIKTGIKKDDSSIDGFFNNGFFNLDFSYYFARSISDKIFQSKEVYSSKEMTIDFSDVISSIKTTREEKGIDLDPNLEYLNQLINVNADKLTFHWKLFSNTTNINVELNKNYLNLLKKMYKENGISLGDNKYSKDYAINVKPAREDIFKLIPELITKDNEYLFNFNDVFLFDIKFLNIKDVKKSLYNDNNFNKIEDVFLNENSQQKIEEKLNDLRNDQNKIKKIIFSILDNEPKLENKSFFQKGIDKFRKEEDILIEYIINKFLYIQISNILVEFENFTKSILSFLQNAKDKDSQNFLKTDDNTNNEHYSEYVDEKLNKHENSSRYFYNYNFHEEEKFNENLKKIIIINNDEQNDNSNQAITNNRDKGAVSQIEENKSLLKILGQKLILEEIQKEQNESSHLDFSYFKSQKKEIQSLIKQYEKEEDNKVKKSIEKKIRQKQKEISNQISLQSIKNFVNNIKSLRNANNENSQALVKQMGKRLGFEPSPLEFSLQSLNKFKNMAEFSRVISNIVLTNIMLQLTQLNTIYAIFSNDQIDENVIRDSFMQLENDFKRLVKSLQEKEVTKKFEDLSSKIEENFGADSSVYLETKDTYERVMSYYQKQFKSLNDFKQSLSEFWENYSKIEKEEEKINERKNMISQFIEIRDSKEIKQIYKIYLVNNSFFNEKLQGIISENSKLSYNEILTSHGYETFESIYQKEKQFFDKTFKKCNEVLGKALGQGRLGKLFDDLEKIKTNLENTKVKPEEEQKQEQEKKEENTQNTQVKQKTVSNKNTKPEQENKQDKTEETSGNKTESKKIKQGLKLLNNDTQLKIYQRKN